MKGFAPTPPPAGTALDGIGNALGFWKYCANLAELWWSRHGGVPTGDIAGQRLRSLVGFAREASPFYRRHYARLPAGGVALARLPIVTKAQLMDRFDDWCTDARVRRDEVERFLADRHRIGTPFLGRYHVWKSSGSTGVPGIFLQDEHAMAVYDALVGAQFDGMSLDTARLVAGGWRAALVVATGDHFASVTSWEHLRRVHPGFEARAFSVLAPVAKLVAELNAFQPAFLASYPSVLLVLASEQRAGRLRIAPALAWSGGEALARAAQAAIEEAFGCRVMNEYGASECLSIAYGCREGWMHVNSEWVVLEGVDAHGHPARPGELSHSVLLTNLANWLQPIIRYDLGDRVTALGGPCACGNPLPAFRVEGRSGEALSLRSPRGAAVRLPPLALETVMEEATGAARFQLAQTAPDRLVVRLDGGAAKSRAAAWRRSSRALRAYLAAQSLSNVEVALDRAAPRIDPRSGKLRSVVVEETWTPKPARH